MSELHEIDEEAITTLDDADREAYMMLHQRLEGIDEESATEEDDIAIRQYLTEHNNNKENPAYIVRGADLMCNCGTNSRKFNLSPCHGVYITDHAVVHDHDRTQGDKENITWFGVCKSEDAPDTENIKLIGGDDQEHTGKKCAPYIVDIWQNSYEETQIVKNDSCKDGDLNSAVKYNTLTMDSFLVCKYGGIIMPINSGQDREVADDEFEEGSEAHKRVLKETEECEEEIDREEGCEGLQHAMIAEEYQEFEVSTHGSEFQNGDNQLEIEDSDNEIEEVDVTIVMLNSWLQAYTSRTCDEEGRIVSMPDGIIPEKWAMRENKDHINIHAERAINGSNEVIQGSNNELVDKEGRYWVAVGPNVMNPDHKGTDKCMADEMNYGTKIDAVVVDDLGNTYYIPCIVGDCKGHTYPTGIYQTGEGYPNGDDKHPENADYSIIEFIGKVPLDNLTNYKIVEIIVYDQ